VVDRAVALFGALGGFIPVDALAAVFDDALAGVDVAPGENAIAVDGRLLDFVGQVGLGCGFGGHGDKVTIDARCAMNIVAIMGGFSRLCRTSVVSAGAKEQ